MYATFNSNNPIFINATPLSSCQSITFFKIDTTFIYFYTANSLRNSRTTFGTSGHFERPDLLIL